MCSELRALPVLLLCLSLTACDSSQNKESVSEPSSPRDSLSSEIDDISQTLDSTSDQASENASADSTLQDSLNTDLPDDEFLEEAISPSLDDMLVGNDSMEDPVDEPADDPVSEPKLPTESDLAQLDALLNIGTDGSVYKISLSEHQDERVVEKLIPRMDDNFPIVDHDFHTHSRFAYDFRNKKMFFGGNNKIYRSDTNGSNIEVIIELPTISKNNVALEFDAATNKIYWAEEGLLEGGAIRRAEPDGSNIETIVENKKVFDLTYNISGRWYPNKYISALEVDSTNGYVYWATYSTYHLYLTNNVNNNYWIEKNSSTVKRAPIDGSGGVQVVPGVRNAPMALELDLPNNRLLVGDAGLGQIYSTDLTTMGYSLLVSNATFPVKGEYSTFSAFYGHQMGLALDGDKVYWTDATANKIYSEDLVTKTRTILKESGPGHQFFGLEFNPDTKKLYFGDFAQSEIYELETDGSGLRRTLKYGLVDPTQLAIDKTEGFIFIVDKQLSAVFRYDIDSQEFLRVVDLEDGLKVTRDTEVALDEAAQKIYWLQDRLVFDLKVSTFRRRAPGTSVFRSNYDGSQVEELRLLGEADYDHLSILDDKVYLLESTATQETILAADLDFQVIERIYSAEPLVSKRWIEGVKALPELGQIMVRERLEPEINQISYDISLRDPDGRFTADISWSFLEYLFLPFETFFLDSRVFYVEYDLYRRGGGTLKSASFDDSGFTDYPLADESFDFLDVNGLYLLPAD